MARAERQTITGKTPEYFSDFLINFDRNPVTGNLARLTNEDAIKQSLKNLILTTLHERFYQPTLGSKIKSLLFDPLDSVSEGLLDATITACFRREPRAILKFLSVKGDIANNLYNIEIHFECINMPGQTFPLAVVLKRLR